MLWDETGTHSMWLKKTIQMYPQLPASNSQIQVMQIIFESTYSAAIKELEQNMTYLKASFWQCASPDNGQSHKILQENRTILGHRL